MNLSLQFVSRILIPDCEINGTSTFIHKNLEWCLKEFGQVTFSPLNGL